MRVILYDALDSTKPMDEFNLDVLPRKDDFIELGMWSKQRYLVLSVTHEISTTDEGYFSGHTIKVRCQKIVL
jgi:hypothetical protein